MKLDERTFGTPCIFLSFVVLTHTMDERLLDDTVANSYVSYFLLYYSSCQAGACHKCDFKQSIV